MGAGQDDTRRARLGTILYTAAEGLRALAVLLAGHPRATEKLWVALGGPGRLVDQPIREAGAWGVLRPGSTSTGSRPSSRVEQSA